MPNLKDRISVDLNENLQYRPVLGKSVDERLDLDIDRVMNKVQYPERLFAGLDDIELPALEQLLRETQLYVLGLRLTNVCNYDCVYCGTAAKRGRDSKLVLRTREYRDVVEQASELGVSSIIFGANGEPLMTKDLLEIVEYTAKHNMTPIIFTNLSILGHDQLCERLHGISGISLMQRLDDAGTSLIIACESLEERTYNAIMGVDTFRYFEAGIERIQSSSSFTQYREFGLLPLCRIAVSTVVMPINYKECHALRDFAHSLNGLIVLKPPSLHGSAKKNAKDMFAPEQVADIRKELNELSDKRATLQILTLACASWTLGLSIDNEGNYMSCMTEEVNPFGEGLTVRNTRLRSVVQRRNELVKLSNTICPVKDKFYTPEPAQI